MSVSRLIFFAHLRLANSPCIYRPATRSHNAAQHSRACIGSSLSPVVVAGSSVTSWRRVATSIPAGLHSALPGTPQRLPGSLDRLPVVRAPGQFHTSSEGPACLREQDPQAHSQRTSSCLFFVIHMPIPNLPSCQRDVGAAVHTRRRIPRRSRDCEAGHPVANGVGLDCEGLQWSDVRKAPKAPCTAVSTCFKSRTTYLLFGFPVADVDRSIAATHRGPRNLGRAGARSAAPLQLNRPHGRGNVRTPCL